MSDISPPTGLKPATRFFKEVGEEMVNADGIIAIMQRVDTPAARRANRIFRRHLSLVRSLNPQSSEKAHNTEALMRTLDELGVTLTNL